MRDLEHRATLVLAALGHVLDDDDGLGVARVARAGQVARGDVVGGVDRERVATVVVAGVVGVDSAPMVMPAPSTPAFCTLSTRWKATPCDVAAPMSARGRSAWAIVPVPASDARAVTDEMSTKPSRLPVAGSIAVTARPAAVGVPREGGHPDTGAGGHLHEDAAAGVADGESVLVEAQTRPERAAGGRARRLGDETTQAVAERGVDGLRRAGARSGPRGRRGPGRRESGGCARSHQGDARDDGGSFSRLTNWSPR